MKIPDHERTPLIKKKPRRPQNMTAEGSNSVEARCKREGITVHPATIRSRMERHGFTFEEAVAYVPKSRSECGRSRKKASPWVKDVARDSAEYQARQGRTKRVGEE